MGILGGKLVMSAGSQPAKTVIDAAGRIVCPGFIDAHSHGDHIIGQHDSSLFKTAQGITTELCGNCGNSPAPVDPERIDIFPMGRHDPEDVKTWTSFDRFLRYAEEAIAIGRHAGVRVDISHHKAAGKPNWGKTKTTLELIRKANEEEGLYITCDQYPYTRNMTGLSACMSSTLKVV